MLTNRGRDALGAGHRLLRGWPIRLRWQTFANFLCYVAQQFYVGSRSPPSRPSKEMRTMTTTAGLSDGGGA
jgi:hypothetical protein